MNYRYYITGRSGTRQVFPSNDGTLEFTYKQESNRSDFTRELEGTIVLIGEDFKWVYEQELSIYRFDLLEITIHKKCNDVWNEDWFRGLISLNSGEWDIDRCKVSLSIIQDDKYICYKLNSSTTHNIFQVTYQRQSLKALEGNIEQHIVHEEQGPNDPPFNPFPGEPNPASKGWLMVERRFSPGFEQPGEISMAGRHYVRWAREVIISSTPLSGNGWIHITGTQYARNPILYDYQIAPYDQYNPNAWAWSYKILDKDINNGIALYDLFKGLLDRVCPELIIESDFFQWNPHQPNDENYVTGEKSKVSNLLVFQKSDIKRPFDSNRSSKGEVTFKDFLEDLCNLFQLEWEINEDGKFKIEHVSYKNRGPGINITIGEHAILNKAKRQYHYDNDEIPKREIFKSKDETPSGDFKGEPIIYDSPIAGRDKDEDVYDLSYFTTDLLLCLENSDPNSKVVSDEGLVLVACADNNSVLREERIRSGNTLNNSLSWAHLHRDYWRHDRYMLNFQMNGANTLALSMKPMKIQEDVRYRLCCPSDFDKDGLITTYLGDNGVLKSAKFNLYKELVEMTVAFPAEGKLVENEPPVANDDFAETYKNTAVVVDVLANDVDGDGVIIPSTLNVVSIYNGTHQITEDFKLRFIPNSGVVGEGRVLYNVKDNFGETSNNARVTIEIKEGSSVPVANGGSFIIAKNLELVQGVGKIFENDTAATAITAIPESKATDNGGLVIIQSNGAFSYLPANDFLGDDEFEYTIKDNYDNTATGTITVTVFEPEDVFVKLVITHTTQEITENCVDGPKNAGYFTRSDIRVLTFADELEETPLDVTGYNLRVKLKREYRDNINNIDDVFDTDFRLIGGTAHVYAQSMMTSQIYYGCGMRPEIDFENTITIEPDTSYTIIY